MTRRALLGLLGGAAVGALGGALGGGALGCNASEGAVEPVWGKQPCDHCRMVLSDKRFGAQLVTTDGDRKFFDDVGCMVLFMEGTSARRTWVHEGKTSAWIDARSARYAPAKSPMDFGFEGRADTGVGWDELRAAVLAKKQGH